MSSIKLAAMALASLCTLGLTACGSDKPALSEDSVPPATIVSVTMPQLDTASVALETTLETTYYAVRGKATEEIFASIEANGPTDNLGQKGSGLTSVDWEYEWSGDRAASGECAIRDLTIRADIVIELPQHEDESTLPAAILENWHKYTAGVAVHEQVHVDIYLAGAEDIRDAMNEIGVQDTCELLEARIDKIWNDEQTRITELQQTFHSGEDARLAAARGPLEAEIEANRVELASLQVQITALDEEIGRLRAEVSVFDTEVANIDAQIRQINDQFPTELPETIRDRLEQLIEQSNDLLVTYNQRVDQHNNAIFQRNALSDQYDALLLETNQYVDRYNWTR